MIIACHLDYSECVATEQKNTGKNYGDCPATCPDDRQKRYDLHRTEHCNGCPAERQWKAFKLDTEALWEQWFGESHGFIFETMLEVLGRISTFEDIPAEKLSVKNAAFVRMLRAERRKADLRRSGS